MKPDVSLDFQFMSSIEQVWNALTNPELLEKWIWKNDFKEIEGYKFQFRAEPNEWWDGIVDCEVLSLDKPNQISYTWASAGESTTVTWTLKKISDDTTQLSLEQSGFSEATKAQEGAIEGANYSWRKMGEQLEEILRVGRG